MFFSETNKMEYKVHDNFIFFPVNRNVSRKKLTFKRKGEFLFSLNVAIDYVTPDFTAKIDLSRFKGETLEITVAPEIPLNFTSSDTDLREECEEPLRPTVHFSPRFGWMNDPNGLIKYGDEYHMFFQHNPLDTAWTNMHWGHAVSKDMIRWEEKEVAVFPDKLGVAFSGSAITDKDNLLGLKEGEDDTVLLFYTSVGPACQSIAYSTDGLKSFKKYSDNPVIGHIIGCNRDPKVNYCEELGEYIVVFYLSEDVYVLQKSTNLKDWTEFQRISLPGDNECPDIFPINDKNGKRKWVLIGAHDKYLVGDFIKGEFVPSQPVQSLHYGTSAYAGQTFQGIDDGRRIRIDWLRAPGIRGKNFCSQMSFPTELTLEKVNNTYYLAANPVSELSTLYSKTDNFENLILEKNVPFTFGLEDTAYYVTLSGKFDFDTTLKFSYFGREFDISMLGNEIKSKSFNGPVSVDEKSLDIKLIIDRASLEIYSDAGKIYYGNVNEYTVCDRNLPNLSITSDNDYTLDKLEIISLKI